MSETYEGLPETTLRHAVDLYDNKDMNWHQVAARLRVEHDRLLDALQQWPNWPPFPETD